MKVLAALGGVVLGFVLFHFSPEGVHALTVGSLVLIGVSLFAFFAALGSDQWRLMGFSREQLALTLPDGKTLKDLILEPYEDLGLMRRRDAILENRYAGAYRGRRVELKIEDDSSRSLTMACANPRRIHLLVVPVLAGFDLYLEILPPKLEGPWPWSDGFEVRGAPAAAARGLIEKVAPGAWLALRARGRGGDSVKLSGESCSFESGARSGESVKERLQLLAAIADAAD